MSIELVDKGCRKLKMEEVLQFRTLQMAQNKIFLQTNVLLRERGEVISAKLISHYEKRVNLGNSLHPS